MNDGSVPPAAGAPARVGAVNPSLAVSHIPSLDGIRAVSFLLVFVSHLGLERIIPGGFGVTVFFFLSGYLITTLMRAEFETTGSVSFRLFYLRRVLRIWPPFYLVLLFAAVTSLFASRPGSMSFAGLSAQLLHVTNYWSIRHGNHGLPVGTMVYWSLAIEEHFYLLFPWLYIGMQRSRLSNPAQAALLWGLCALVLLWRCILVFHFHVSDDRTHLGTDTRVDSILFGCALAVWRNPVLDRPTLRPTTWQYVLVPAAFLALILAFVWRGDAFRETFRYSLQGIALTLLFVAAVRFPGWPLFRFLNTRPMEFIGALSYTLYLVHLAILLVIEHNLAPGLPMYVQAPLALLASVLFAYVMYRLVEKPCAQLRRRLSRLPHFAGRGAQVLAS